MPGLYFLELPPVIDAGRSERAAPVTMSATALAATSVRSFVALATWSPASFAASRALATCGLSDLLTRAAAAALAAATSALARISRPRSELTRLSSAFVRVVGTRIPITLADDRADFLAARVGARPFVLGDLRACLPALVVCAPDPVFDLPALAIARLTQRFTAFHYQLRSVGASPAERSRARGNSARLPGTIGAA